MDDVDDDDDIDPREGIYDSGESEDESEDDDDESDDEEIGDEIVETFILTFHNGDYDIEFDDALSYDRSVTLMVRPTQTFYNKPENWRERNCIGLEKIKRELQSCIHKVTNQQSFLLKLTHIGYGHQLMDNEVLEIVKRLRIDDTDCAV